MLHHRCCWHAQRYDAEKSGPKVRTQAFIFRGFAAPLLIAARQERGLHHRLSLRFRYLRPKTTVSPFFGRSELISFRDNPFHLSIRSEQHWIETNRCRQFFCVSDEQPKACHHPRARRVVNHGKETNDAPWQTMTIARLSNLFLKRIWTTFWPGAPRSSKPCGARRSSSRGQVGSWGAG
jgi:hypothetical protein